MKDLNEVNSNNIMSPRLLQSKSYLKILDFSDIIESIIKSTHIFNDIVLASQPCVIKAFPKSNMMVIWVDI